MSKEVFCHSRLRESCPTLRRPRDCESEMVMLDVWSLWAEYMNSELDVMCLEGGIVNREVKAR